MSDLTDLIDDVEHLAETLNCYRAAEDGGDYCGEVDDCARCGLLRLVEIYRERAAKADPLHAALEAIADGSWYRIGEHKFNLPAAFARDVLDKVAP